MVLVVGMARSGVAAARLLASRGKSVFVTDAGEPASTAELEAAGIPYETGHHTRTMFLDAEEIVMSPGVPLDIEPLSAARARRVPIISEIELAFRYLKGEIVAITGSNGKTTTTTLVGEILKSTGRPVQVGGNIGVAMSSLVSSSTSETINVVEVSSFQLDGIALFRSRVGVLLNITPDHLDRYSGYPAYRASKFRLFMNQVASDTAVLNADDKQVYPPLNPIAAGLRLFSRKHAVEAGAFQQDNFLFLDGQRVMEAAEFPLRGNHNIENVLASMAVAGVYRVAPEAVAESIRTFRGVEHRIEFAGSFRGIDFYNDSKATNVDSAIKAVESFSGKIILILGGKDKGASYSPLVEAMKGRVKHVVLIGAAAEKIGNAIGSIFPKTIAVSMRDAVTKAAQLGQSGDVVLLSPACASFDMFENYEHRGKVFKETVQELIAGRANV